MSYVQKNLIPGETLLYETRHHWVVLLKFLLFALLLGGPGVALLVEAAAKPNGLAVSDATIEPKWLAILGGALCLVAIIIWMYGIAKRNSTEMAVTNRRLLIKSGMGGRRTLDLMLSRVESIGVEETVLGRMLGYGSVIVHGTGGTPEPFLLIAHPQEFRRAVQTQLGQDQSTSGK
jgi:hypothetical protein